MVERIPFPVVLLTVLSWMSKYRVGASVFTVPLSAPVLMPGEFAVLLALIVLNAMMHLLALAPVPELLPNLLQAMPLPFTLVMLLACPLAPIVQNASTKLPDVTWIPFVPIPALPGPAPIIVFPLIRNGLASEAMFPPPCVP